jgi:Mg2+ and Co2+ transporters
MQSRDVKHVGKRVEPAMGVDLNDNRGLICGFAAQDGRLPRSLDAAAIEALSQAPEHPVWLHFNYNDGRARDWIANCAWIPEAGREALLSTDHSIRFETADDGVFLVLGEAHVDDRESFGVFNIYLDRRCMVTSRRHQLTALGALRNELAHGQAMADTTALFIRLLEHKAATYAKATQDSLDVLENFEDWVFSGRFREVNSLGRERQLMARVRRQRAGNRQALTDMLEHLPTWWSEEAKLDLRRAVARLTSISQDLDLAIDRARLLSEEIDSRMNEATNRNLYLVSVLAAVFLPITLVSGVFGMNVEGLPWVDDPHGFVWTLLLMAGAILMVLWFLRRRGVF